jgi:hypothetical protein
MSQLATIDRRAVSWGVVAVLVAVSIAVLGSGNLRWFDAALVGYLFGTLLAIFAASTATSCGCGGHRRRGSTGAAGRRSAAAADAVATRSPSPAWLSATCSRSRSYAGGRGPVGLPTSSCSGGCVLAAVVTFPLVFGLLHFESVAQNGRRYRTVVGEIETFAFDARSVVGWITFHLLDVSAVLVLAGVFIFLARRLRDPGELATERSNDFLPLAGLFAVSVTGLALTASNLWMDGRFYVFLNTVHALTVILGLMYIPFGKLFHIFQRPANLGVEYYKREGAAGEQQRCSRCGRPFASQLQIGDLKEVLPQVGFDYSSASGGNYQDHCPPCRRTLVALAQSQAVGGFG